MACYPRASDRAEITMKSAKGLVLESLSPCGNLDTDAFAQALIKHRNTINQDTGLSLAMIVLEKEIKGLLLTPEQKVHPRQEWKIKGDLCEQAHRNDIISADAESCMTSPATPSQATLATTSRQAGPPGSTSKEDECQNHRA